MKKHHTVLEASLPLKKFVKKVKPLPHRQQNERFDFSYLEASRDEDGEADLKVWDTLE